jgi:hypothetical protein
MSEAQRLADKLNSLCVAEFAWPHLNNAATELRRLAPMEAEVSQLRADANDCGSGAGCCYQAAQNERLEAELQQAREERTALLVNEQNLCEELAALRAVPAIPDDCDARKILLAVTPGDGSGYEVYAKNCRDVEDMLTKIGSELEEWQLGIRRLSASPQAPQPTQP